MNDLPPSSSSPDLKTDGKELSTAKSQSKKDSPNSLIVADQALFSNALYDLNSVVYMHSKTMSNLGFQNLDYILLKGNKKRETVCMVYEDPRECEETKAKMNKVVQQNLAVSSNGRHTVLMSKCSDIKDGKRVAFVPIEDTLKGELKDNILYKNLTSYFHGIPVIFRSRPVRKGDIFLVGDEKQGVEFKVIEIETETGPAEYCIVAYKTEIVCEGKPIKRSDDVRYGDIGGIKHEMKQQILKVVELPLRSPQIFKKFGTNPSKGILLTGPPGTGKSLIARAIANESGAFFSLVNGPQAMSGMPGETEKILRNIFEEAAKKSPAIIILDEIDSIAPKRDNTNGDTERSTVTQLLITLMDGLNNNRANYVIILGSTNRPDSIDPALRKPGRFDRELVIDPPDEAGRLEILDIHTSKMRLDNVDDLKEIAKNAQGYVGADLAALCNDAYLESVQEIDDKALASMVVTKQHFLNALKNSQPSSLLERPDDKVLLAKQGQTNNSVGLSVVNGGHAEVSGGLNIAIAQAIFQGTVREKI